MRPRRPLQMEAQTKPRIEDLAKARFREEDFTGLGCGSANLTTRLDFILSLTRATDPFNMASYDMSR